MANESFEFPDELEDKGKAAAEPEVEIEIVDDVPLEDRGRKPLEEAVDDPSDEEVAQYSSKVQARIKGLTHARHDERRAKEALQREHAELEKVTRTVIQERDALQAQFGKGVEVMTTQAKTMANTELATAKAKLKAAHEAFDTDAIVEAQVLLNDAQMRRANIENIRYVAPQVPKTVVDSPVTAPAAAPKLDKKTSDWMSNNRWFGEGGDKAMTGYALGLHQDMVEKYGDDFTRTDEYYSQIDTALRQAFPTKLGGAKKPTSIVAPATRMLAAPKKVQLTSTQVALARKLGLTPQQYAAEVVKMEAQ